MKLKPMADNVLLKQHEAAETTVSGIILATLTVLADFFIGYSICPYHSTSGAKNCGKCGGRHVPIVFTRSVLYDVSGNSCQ